MKKPTILISIGLTLVVIGAMLGDNEKIIPCIPLIAVGIGFIFIGTKKQAQIQPVKVEEDDDEREA